MPYLVVLAVGAVGGWVAARGVEETAGLVKWGVIGGAVYIAGRHFKAW